MAKSDPRGEVLFQIIGAIAQWERSLIVERVKAGLEHARSQGKRLGRPRLRVLKPKDVAELGRNVRTRKLTVAHLMVMHSNPADGIGGSEWGSNPPVTPLDATRRF